MTSSKGNNVSKFITNKMRGHLAELERFLPDNKERPAHLQHVKRLLEKMEGRNVNTEDMSLLFGPQANPRQERWAKLRREFMQRMLAL